MIARTGRNRNSMKSTICKAIACMLLMFSLPTWSNALPDIVVLGDDTRVLLVKQCTQPCRSGENSVAAATLGSSASSIASLAQRAKHAVIVVDATQGPLQIIREHILIARQAGVPSLSLLFVNTDRVKDSELLKMEEQEARALLNTYEMNGDHAALFTVKTLRRCGDELSGALAALKKHPGSAGTIALFYQRSATRDIYLSGYTARVELDFGTAKRQSRHRLDKRPG